METKKYKNEEELESKIYETLVDAGDINDEFITDEIEEAIRITKEDWKSKFEIKYLEDK